jgi:hypothetical protein
MYIWLLLQVNLSLDYNQLTDVHAALMAQMLRGNKALRNLSLYNNNITNEGLELMFSALGKNTTLLQLNVASQQNVFKPTTQLHEKILHLFKSNRTVVFLQCFSYYSDYEEWKFQLLIEKSCDRNYDYFLNRGWSPDMHLFFSPKKQAIIMLFYLTFKFDKTHLLCTLPPEIWLIIFSYVRGQKNIEWHERVVRK